jgi:hypothetical protein
MTAEHVTNDTRQPNLRITLSLQEINHIANVLCDGPKLAAYMDNNDNDYTRGIRIIKQT